VKIRFWGTCAKGKWVVIDFAELLHDSLEEGHFDVPALGQSG
jgi:hypothetical protein